MAPDDSFELPSRLVEDVAAHIKSPASLSHLRFSGLEMLTAHGRPLEPWGGIRHLDFSFL